MLASKKLIWVVAFALIITSGFWGAKQAWNFLKDRPAKKYYGEEALVQTGFVPLGQWGRRDTKYRKKSSQDIIIKEGTEVMRDTELFQTGNIIVEGGARLAFQNSIVEMTPGIEPRANIFVRDNSEIIFDNSTLKPHADDPANLYVYLEDSAKFIFTNSYGLHMLIASGNSQIQIYNSEWAYSGRNFRGGGVQLSGSAKADIKNSIIGGIIIELPPEARVNIKGFTAKKFANLDFQKDFGLKNAGLNVLLENTQILGDYLEGGSERGLSIFAPLDISRLTIENSELNKLVIESTDENLEFANLKLDYPHDFVYKNISVKNSRIMAQWGFSLRGGQAKFSDSDGLWFFIYDDAKLTLENSTMNEFDPRQFTGGVDFINSTWENAGEIIGSNDFLWSGSWVAQGFEKDTFRPLIWDNSKVTREFSIDVFLLNTQLLPARGAEISIFDNGGRLLERVFSDKDGHAVFTVLFDDTNYRDTVRVKVSKFDMAAEREINFLTPTPVKLIIQ